MAGFKIHFRPLLTYGLEIIDGVLNCLTGFAIADVILGVPYAHVL